MGLGQFLKLGAGRLLPHRVMVHGDCLSPEVAITFDDGPHPQHTPLLLEALARRGAMATFFLQGDHAARWPQWVREIHGAGHQVANHSYSHVRARDRSSAEFVREVERTQQLLQDLVGCELARDYRPPYGNITGRTFLNLAYKGYRCVFWSKDSDDSTQCDVGSLVASVAYLKLGPGDIVLFHEDYAHTIAAMPTILGTLQAAGLTMKRVDRMVRHEPSDSHGVSS